MKVGYKWSSQCYIFDVSLHAGFPGNVSVPSAQASGAYIFRPYKQVPQPVSSTRTV